MNLFKKILVPSKQNQELTAYETWAVRWRSRNGRYSSDIRDEMELFTSKEDAEKFATALREAFKLIRHTSGDKVEVSKN